MDTQITVRGCTVRVMQGDITSLALDAIVNAANNKLVMGGGVAASIRQKGGASIEEEAVSRGPIAVGQAVATSAGILPARYVIHAATMSMDFKTDEFKVRSACRSALQVAQDLKLVSIAFCALGCGTGGFPYLACAKIMAQEVFRYTRQKDATLREVVFCLYDTQAYEVFAKGVVGYLSHVTQELGGGPYVTVDAIIEVSHDEIVVIERSNPPFGWALPGGFVDYGESLEEAVAREAREETALELTSLRQFHTYSDPSRDPRFHTIGTVYIAKAEGAPKAGDDAAGLKVVKISELEKMEFAFDHKRILQDYCKARMEGAPRR